MMSQEKIKNIIEAALMVSTQPLSVTRLLNLFEAEQTMQVERDDLKTAIAALQNDYQERGIELAEVASGFRFQARDDYASWVNHLFDERPPRYSRALLETLAIIAYRQPITRSEIEEIRGVSVSSTIVKTLQEREWVKVVGHRDVPGKPALLATTKSFLDYFNLKKLSELPALEDIKDFDAINPDLFEDLEGEARAKEQNESDTVTENSDTENTEAVANEERDIESVSGEEDVNEVEVHVVDDVADSEAVETEAEESEEEKGATVVPFAS
ncbi:MAG: SMC-Scp complex subunit ScpB [Proteobacteria bacterium]|nr:SMC-Scp complex subunit ScpB [Pseudomonadota bacterium]NOG59615.1 SMC-Scp complex subunit ScpB [Pseudomonadota bacterium]